MVLRLPVEWFESIPRCYLIKLVYSFVLLHNQMGSCCAKNNQKQELQSIQMGQGSSLSNTLKAHEEREKREVAEAVGPVLKWMDEQEKQLPVGREESPVIPSHQQHVTLRENFVKEEKSRIDRLKSFLDMNREDKNADSEQEEQMKKWRREREEANRRFNEKQMSLAIERYNIMNNYHMKSTMIKEEVSAELTRITDQSRRTEVSFEEKLRADEEERDRLLEEIRNKRREKPGQTEKFRVEMARLVRHLLYTYLSNEAEKEWSQKLSSLRKVHEPVHLRFTTLHAFIFDQIKNGDLKLSVPHEHATEQIKNLQCELREERTTMEDAVVYMQEFKIDHPQAKFLTDIEESAMSVLESATILLSKVAEVEFELKSVDRLIHITLLNECKHFFDELEKSVNTIPTVMDLRRKYEK